MSGVQCLDNCYYSFGGQNDVPGLPLSLVFIPIFYSIGWSMDE